MPEPSDTERLEKEQASREEQERALAKRAEQPEEEREMHARRSEKAGYLREKLEEQRRAPDD
jgi:hypothetical protein